MKLINQAPKKMKNLIMPLIILVLFFSLLYVNIFGGKETSIKHTVDGVFLEASGIIENNTVVVSSEVPGNIAKLYVKEGDTVVKGQEIAKIDDTLLQKQFLQAQDGAKLAETKLDSVKVALENLKIQNQNQITQAYNTYMAAKAYYEKVKLGPRPQEIRQAENMVAQTESAFQNAQENLSRVEFLLKEGAVAKQKYDEIKTAYDAAKAQMEAAKEKLSLLKEGASEQEIEIARSQAAQAEAAYNLTVSSAGAQVDAKEKELEMAKTQLEQAVTAMKQASDQLGKTVIKSPVDGIVYVKSLNEGEMASIGVPVVEILDTSDTRLDVYVAESDIGLVKLHQKAKIFIDSFPGKVFEGEVIEISSRAEFTPKNIQTKKERVNTVFKVTIKIADTSGVIKPGMPADVQIKID